MRDLVCQAGKWLALVCAVASAASCGNSRAQAPVADGSTLHVYANLLQIPVLVLDRRHEPLPPIAPASFSVQLGQEKPFAPRLVRRQGDDPLTLAILLDGSKRGSLMPFLLDSLPGIAGTQLTGRDRVALYALDGCKLRRFSMLMPASEALVKDAVGRAVAFAPYDVNKPGTSRCEQPIGLWDALDYVTLSLSSEPGRRVVLAVTNGDGVGSRVLPVQLRKNANRVGVAVFALAERYLLPPPGSGRSGAAPGWEMTSWLAEITEGTGGMVMEGVRNNLPYSFKHFVQLLRGRYIVEFSRPAGLTGGTSILTIACGQPRAFLRAAGTSVPITDPVARDERVEHGSSSPSLPSSATAQHGP